MRQKIFFVMLSCVLAGILESRYDTKRYALVKYPVIDLYGSPTVPDKPLPAAAATSAICPRIHQGLFNECFEIQKASHNMVALTIPWAIYDYDSSGNPHNRYWAAEKDLLFLESCGYTADFLKTIPRYAGKKTIITLQQPFTNAYGITYSVGTPFVCTGRQPDPHAFLVRCIDSNRKMLRDFFIPREIVYINRKKSSAQARRDFVRLLTSCIKTVQEKNGRNTVPYVWGGGSFTQPYREDFMHDVDGFHRTEKESVPLSGYDCSLLVLRFAHMAGVPYFFKTTAALEKYGKKFTPSDTLQEGDLIWLPGHVVIITDLKNTRVTEAAGYENFVGRVHTIPLNKLLKDMHTWDDLLDAYYKKRQVMRLDKFGNNFKESPVKIFKLF